MKICRKCKQEHSHPRCCPSCAKIRQKKWREAHPDKKREATRRWRESNIERAREVNANWNKSNPDSMRLILQNYRAKKRDSGILSKGLAQRLYNLQRGLCACGCGEKLGKDYHLDHIMPIALGGRNADDNIQLLKSTCNRQKHSKHPIDFMQERGFLL